MIDAKGADDGETQKLWADLFRRFNPGAAVGGPGGRRAVEARFPVYQRKSRQHPTSSTAADHHATSAKASALWPARPGSIGLTFSDEFTGTTLNHTTWATEYGFDTYCVVDTPPPPATPTYCNRSNNDEKEWYVDDAPRVENGVLKLEARKNDCSGDQLPNNYPPYSCANFPYLSGMVSTHDRFSQLYGYFEARIKILDIQGFWPAFWLIPQLPRPPSPDVEYFWPPESTS
jgi:beta-glucanase (GH16 family)